MFQALQLAIYPGVAIALAVLGLNLMGAGAPALSVGAASSLRTQPRLAKGKAASPARRCF